MCSVADSNHNMQEMPKERQDSNCVVSSPGHSFHACMKSVYILSSMVFLFSGRHGPHLPSASREFSFPPYQKNTFFRSPHVPADTGIDLPTPEA